jgi:hypothetical protein
VAFHCESARCEGVLPMGAIGSPPTLAKNARMGHPRSNMGKEEQGVEKGGPAPSRYPKQMYFIVFLLVLLLWVGASGTALRAGSCIL